MSRARILFVEDESNLRRLLKSEFGREDYDVGVASKFDEAKTFLEYRAADVVVTDWRGVDGSEVVKYVSSHYPKTKVIVYSGKDRGNDVDGRVYACVIKSGDLSELIRTIADAINGGKQNE